METKPLLYYDSKGPTGNIFYIWGKATELLKIAGTWESAEELHHLETCKSYNEALSVISKYCTLFDVAQLVHKEKKDD